jgi:hypothetical protein
MTVRTVRTSGLDNIMSEKTIPVFSRNTESKLEKLRKSSINPVPLINYSGVFDFLCGILYANSSQS